MSQCTKCGARFIGTAANPPKPGLCHYCERDEMKAELERVQKRETALRKALQRIEARIRVSDVLPDSNWFLDLTHAALATDAGSNFVSRESIYPLATALFGIRANIGRWQQLLVVNQSGIEALDRGIDHAKTLGFTP